MAAIPKNVEMEAAKFLHKLIQESTDEPTNLATKLHVILQHMRSTGKENSMPYHVISRAMETVIKRHGLDIEALMSQSQPLTGGSQPSLSQMAGPSQQTVVESESKKPLTAEETATFSTPFKEHQLKQLRAQCLVFLAFRNNLVPEKLHLETALGNFFSKEVKMELLSQKGNQVSGFSGKDMNNAGVLGGRKREDQEFMSYKKKDDQDSNEKLTGKKVKDDSNKKERSNKKRCTATNTSEEHQVKDEIMDTIQTDVKSTPQNGPKMRSCRTGSTKSKISEYGFFYGNWEDDVVLEEEDDEEDFANDDEGNVDKNDKQTLKELFGLKNVKTTENDIDSIKEKKQKSIEKIVNTKETLRKAMTKEIFKNIKLENDVDYTEEKNEKSFVNQIEDHDEHVLHFEADTQNATPAILSPDERMDAIEKELKDQKEVYNHDKLYFKSRLDDVVKTVETSNSQIGQVFKVLESINDRVSSNYTKDELQEIFSGLRGDLATVNNRLNLILTQPLFTPAQLSKLESQFDVAKNGKMS